MSSLNYSQLVVGQVVAVARYGSYTIMNQGFYKVVKVDKRKVVLQREGSVDPNYTRTFSVITGKELNSSSLRSSWIEPVAVQEARAQMQAREQNIKILWNDIEACAINRKINELKEKITQLEALLPQ